MLLVFEKLGLCDAAKIDELLVDCDVLSRKITTFSRTLLVALAPSSLRLALRPYPLALGLTS